MEPAGHGGAWGRYDQLKDRAFELLWLLTQLGIHDRGESMLRPIAFLWMMGSMASGQGSLKTVSVPKPDVSAYVQDDRLLVVLGKALFWDMQLGSDRRVACASCHFHAGADHRVQNQLSNPLEAFP